MDFYEGWVERRGKIEHTLIKLTNVAEAIIIAFNIETGIFPDGFDTNTGQYK